jgi:putative flippase GtrA
MMNPKEKSSDSATMQFARFGIVGAHAAGVNFIALMVLVEFFHFSPLVANIFAFLIAFQVSYWGHRRFTFRSVKHQTRQPMRKTALRYFVVASLSFLLNEGFFALFLNYFHMYYLIAMILTLVFVPPITFVLSKVWAFANPE